MADFDRPFNVARKLGFIPELQCNKAAQKLQLTFIKISQHLRNMARHVHSPFGCLVPGSNHQIEDLWIGNHSRKSGASALFQLTGAVAIFMEARFLLGNLPPVIDHVIVIWVIYNLNLSVVDQARAAGWIA
jgi:hypothetical protein